MSDDFPQPNKELEAAAAIESQAEAVVEPLDVTDESHNTNQSQEPAEPMAVGDGATADVRAAVIDTDDEDVDPFDGASDDDELDDEDESEESEDDEDAEDFDDDLEEEDDDEDDDDEDDAPYDLDADDEDESLVSSDLGGDDDHSAAPKKSKRPRGVAAEGISDIVAYEPESSADGDNDPSPEGGPKRDHSKHVAKFEPQRLAKILAASGLDARRKCEEYVTAGRVSVDGEVIKNLAFRADPYSQKIELDGERIKQQRKVYFILNKPRGVVCSNNDPEGRPRIIDMFPEFFKERMFTIGRLDSESEGLILVTNDGELANRMAHPRYRVPKFYLCHVKGVPSPDTLAALKRGMYFEEGRFSVEGVRMKKTMGDSAYLDIVLNEGQNREIRRLLARVDHKVMRLKRVGFGPIRLGDIPSGAFRPLTNEESKLLKNLSEQRAHLDKAASRGRKGKVPKPPYGIKGPFGSKKAYGAKPGFASKSGYVKTSVDENGEFPVKRNYADKLRSRQVSTSRDANTPDVSNRRSERDSRGSDRDDRGSRRPASGSRPVSDASGESFRQRPPRDDRPPQRRLVEASNDDFDNDDAIPSQSRPTTEGRFDNRPPQREYNRPQSGEYSPRPQYGESRPPRRYPSSNEGQPDQSALESLPPRQYGNRPQQGGYGQRSQQQGGYSQRPQYGADRPPRKYPSNDEGQSSQSDEGFPPQRRYGNRPQQGGYNQRPPGGYNDRPQAGYNQRPQYGNDRPPRRSQSDDSSGSNQNESFDNDSDFNGGRRRSNNQDDESDFTPRPQSQRPPRREGGYSQRPPQAQGRPTQGGPPQRHYGSQEGTGNEGGNSGQRRYSSQQEGTGGGYSGQRRYGSQGGGTSEQSGGYSGQRRPGGYRDDNQSQGGGYQSGPPRGRGRPPARAPRPMTADGKEILEGKVTGYRTPPKEGLPRRPYKAVLGMKGNREQRQQRRKKD